MSKINKVLYNVDQTAGTNGTTADERKLARKNIGLNEVVGHAATASESGIAPLDENGKVPDSCLPSAGDTPGVVALKNSIDANESCEDKAVTPKAVKDEIDSLDNTPNGTSGTGTNVTVKVTQTKGKITGVTVTDDTATANHTHGHITNDGKIENPYEELEPVLVAEDGTIGLGLFGSAANAVARGNHTHPLTFTTSSGTPDYVVNAGDVVSLSAGGTTKKVKFELDYVNTLEDPFIPPDVAGSMWHNAKTGDIWIANGNSSVKDWILVHNRIHDLIVQRQTVTFSGQGSSRAILCDKQNYTLSEQGYYTFARVDPYEIAKWKNRGDVINVGGEVDFDPWGDGYPMRMTEYQATKDANDEWYCTNINLRGFKYDGSVEKSYWGNINHDDETDKDFIEFQSW